MAPTTIFNLLLKLNSNTSLAEVTKISPLKVRTKNLLNFRATRKGDAINMGLHPP